MNAVQGYVHIDELETAIPTSIHITQLPSCGVVYRETTTIETSSFAVFWEYDYEQTWTIIIEVGDTINFAADSIFYDPDETCDELETSF